MPRFLQRISVEQVQQGEFYQESLLYRRVCSQPRKETHPNRGTWPRVRWRGAARSEHNNSAAQQARLVHVAKHEASPGSTGALGGSPARLEAPLRAALRRVRLRAKGSAEPAQPARPGPGVTPALPQRLWQGGGLWAGPPPLTEPQHRDAVAAGNRHRGDTARTGPARRCHNALRLGTTTPGLPCAPTAPRAAGSRARGAGKLGVGKGAAVSQETRSRETGSWEPGCPRTWGRVPASGAACGAPAEPGSVSPLRPAAAGRGPRACCTWWGWAWGMPRTSR